MKMRFACTFHNPVTRRSCSSAAVIVGHDSVYQGALNYQGQSEFSYNYGVAFFLRYLMTVENRVNFYVVRKYNGDKQEIYDAIAKGLNERGVENVYELHFNSFHEPILGGEALYLTSRGKLSAERFLHELKAENLSIRTPKIVSGGGRGHIFLSTMEKAGIANAAILEPCFGNFENIETNWFFEDSGKKYARMLKNFIMKDAI